MSQQRRKIGYYVLYIKQPRRDTRIDPTDFINQFLPAIIAKSQPDRILDSGDDKFFFLDYIVQGTQNGQPIFKGYFKSAKYNHRPPLIDKDTAQERANPKHLHEGESEKTHFVLKIDTSTNDIIILLEERKSGIGITSIMSYFRSMPGVCQINKPGVFGYGTIPVENFMDGFNDLSDVKVAEVYYDRQVVGSKFVEFANLSSQAKDEIVIRTTAKKRESIKHQLYTAVQNFITGTGRSQASKMRIYGNSENGNPVMLDSSLSKKKNYVDAELDPITKVVESSTLLDQIAELIEEL